MLQADNHNEDAYLLFQRARQAGVADPDIEPKLGFMEIARGSASSARKAFERAVQLNPLSGKALEGLGRVAHAEGQYLTAADYYDRALKVSPSADLAKTLGSIRLNNLNDIAGAREAYLKALELMQPEDTERKILQEILESLEKTQ